MGPWWRVMKLVTAIACAGVLVVAGMAGCGGKSSGSASSAPPTPRGTYSATTTPSLTPPATTSPSATTSPTVVSCVQRTLQRLTLPQRVGQLFMGGVLVDRTPAFVSSTLGAVRVGAILLVGQATAGTRAVATAASRARTVAGTPAGVRAIVAVDQEGGLVQHLKGPGFEPIPSASEQARLTPSQLRTRAAAWGQDLRAASVDLDLAPVADVVPASVGTANRPIGALHRGYGSDPSSVGQAVAAFVAGMGQAGVATTVKHFPGLGKVRGNTDFTAGVVDRVTTRDDPDLAPFGTGIEAGARFLMVSLATYSKIDPSRRAVFSATVIDGMVRNDLGFDGVVLSDDLGAAAEVRTVPPAQRALRFLRAGGDLIVTAETSILPAMTQAVIAAARSSRSFRSAIDQHVLRVLAAKRAMGLLACS